MNPSDKSFEQACEQWEAKADRSYAQNEIARQRHVQYLYNRQYRKERNQFKRLSIASAKLGAKQRAIEKIQERHERQFAFVEVWDDAYRMIDKQREWELMARTNYSDAMKLRKSQLRVRKYK